MARGNEDARKLDGLPGAGEFVAPDGVTPERDDREPDDDDRTDQFLIEQTQRYLARRRQQEDPSADLLAAWERFYRLYDVLIRRDLARRGILESDRDDLAQDVWRGLMRTLEEFECDRSRGRFRAWLDVVVVNKVREFCRNRAQRENRIKLTDRIDKLDIRCDDHDPARQSDRDLRRGLLRYALERLRPDVIRQFKTSHRILELRFLEERSVAETARLLNLDPRHVTFRLCRVLKKLRLLLEFYATEPSLVTW